MARYIHFAQGDTTLEVVKHVEGNGILNIRLSNGEFELNRTLSEKQVYALYRDLRQFYEGIKYEKEYIATVSFFGIDGCDSNKTYYFLSNIKDLSVGEYIFVDSAGKHCVGKFMGYQNNLNWKPSKYVIKRAKPVTMFI